MTVLQVRPLVRAPPGADGGWVSGLRNTVVHCWFVPPLQVHTATAEPFAVFAPNTSRHRPDSTPRMLWSAVSVHR